MRTRAAAAALSLCMSLSACAAFWRPEQLQTPRLVSIRLDQSIAQIWHNGSTIHLEFKNPNAIGVVLSHLNYQIQEDGQQIAFGALEEEQTLAADGSSWLKMPVKLEGSKLVKILSKQLIAGTYKPIEVTARAKVRKVDTWLPFAFNAHFSMTWPKEK